MAKYGEWNRKGAVLSHVTAEKEYGVTEQFIVRGIREGRLEFRQGANWGNPYLRLLRSQLEEYITEERGADFLAKVKGRTELCSIQQEIRALKQRLASLEDRERVLEAALKPDERRSRRRKTGGSPPRS